MSKKRFGTKGKTISKKWIHAKYLEAVATAVRATFDPIPERNQLCVYINLAAMKVLNNMFPKEIMGMTIGSLAFLNTEETWDFVFDTQHEGGIYDMRFHLVFLHQVKKTVRMIDFTIPYWRDIATEANKIDMGDAALINVDSVNSQNKSYVYHTDISQYGANFEQDREQNKIFHEELLPELYTDLTKYIKPLQMNFQKIVQSQF